MTSPGPLPRPLLSAKRSTMPSPRPNPQPPRIVALAKLIGGLPTRCGFAAHFEVVAVYPAKARAAEGTPYLTAAR